MSHDRRYDRVCFDLDAAAASTRSRNRLETVDKPFSAYAGDDPYIFVSYAHADAARVYPEIQWLHDQGFNVWYDEVIEPGSIWRDELAKAIAGASLFVFFATPMSVERPHCRREVDFAIDRETPFITVYLEPTDLPDGLELSLASVQAIVKYEETEREYRRKLVAFAGQHTVRGVSAAKTVARSDRPSLMSTLSAVLAIAVLAVGFLLGVFSASFSDPDVAPNETLRRVVPSADVEHDTYAPTFAVSDSGTHIAFISAEFSGRTARLFVWDRTAFAPVEVDLDGDNPFNVGLSPDGQWVVYRSLLDGDLKRVPVGGGGSASTISSAVAIPAGVTADRGIAWAKEFIYIATRNRAIQQVLIRTGERSTVTLPPAGSSDGSPEYLHEHDALLFDRTDLDRSQHVMAVDLETSSENVIVAGRNPQFVRGKLLFEKDNRIWGASLDTTTWTLAAEPASLFDKAAAFDISANGDLLYASENRANALRTLVLVTEADGETAIPNLPPDYYRDPVFSPDGSEIAFVRGDGTGGGDLYTMNVSDFSVRRLTNDPHTNLPTWSPDGREILFTRTTGSDHTNRQLLAIPAHGLQDARALSLDGFFVPTIWAGDELFYTDIREVAQISTFDLKSGEIDKVFENRYATIRPALSPNRQFLAYLGLPGNRFETFVRPYPATDTAAYPLTQADCTNPVWSRTRDDVLYCRLGLDVVELTLDFAEGVRVTNRRVLWERPPYPPSGSRWNYDIDATGCDSFS